MDNVIERSHKEYKRQVKRLENWSNVMFNGLIHVSGNLNILAGHVAYLGKISRQHISNNLILAQTLKDAGATTVTIDSGVTVPIDDWMNEANAILEQVDQLITSAASLQIS